MTEQLLAQLAQQGGLIGTIVALLVSIIFVLVKLLLSEKDKRIQDALTYRDNLVGPIENLTEFVKAALGGKEKR